ncbi:DUF1330 domain-containing protein [Paraglaciecola sp. 2405UD69-4]|uniref:DUF1330 domain-containing protein n=1 Tax=Paraglaciecola sp. 2405UD69-4 TaxID=3391836 RepID=UPI0039C9AAA1
MKTLVIVDITPINKIKLAEYSAQAAETLKPFNGIFIAKGPVEVLHGDAKHPMKAVIEFPDKQNAKNWYKSKAYQDLISLREQGMQSQFHLL